MSARIILFRGMNTGGVRAPVTEQRAMALEMGLQNPRTLLASGNLVVDSDIAPPDLEALIEVETERRFGRRIEAIVRTREQWARMMTKNPFAEVARTDPSRLLVMVMKAGIRPGGLEAIQAFATAGEAVEVSAGELWFWHPHGIGTSKMAEKAQPRLLGMGTARNWNTVCKLATMVDLTQESK